MATKNIHNPGPNILFVGSILIPPGEGRDVDEAHLPPEHVDAPAPLPEEEPSTLHDDVAEFLGLKVADIVPKLPNISFEALDLAEQMEREAKHPRTTLLAAMADERLRRASDKVDGDSVTGAEGADSVTGADGADTLAGGQA